MRDVTGVILCGGLGSRMGYARKAFLRVGGRTILDRLLAVFTSLFDEVVLADRDLSDLPPPGWEGRGLRLARDAFEARSSLTGIQAGLAAAKGGRAFVCACDAPFLRPGLVAALLAQAGEEDDVVIPRKEDGYLEPLCAVYSRRCLPHMEAQLAAGDFKIVRFFPQVRVRAVDADLLRPADPEFLSFFNVNAPEDLERAEILARRVDHPAT